MPQRKVSAIRRCKGCASGVCLELRDSVEDWMGSKGMCVCRARQVPIECQNKDENGGYLWFRVKSVRIQVCVCVYLLYYFALYFIQVVPLTSMLYKKECVCVYKIPYFDGIF